MGFNSRFVNALIATQNALLKDEVVTKRGLVGQTRLADVLSLDSSLKQRAGACQEATSEYLSRVREHKAKLEQSEKPCEPLGGAKKVPENVPR